MHRKKFILQTAAAYASILFSPLKKWQLFQNPKEWFTIILGRATNQSVAVHIYSKQTASYYIAYGNSADKLVMQTTKQTIIKGETLVFTLDKLSEDKNIFTAFTVIPKYKKATQASIVL